MCTHTTPVRDVPTSRIRLCRCSCIFSMLTEEMFSHACTTVARLWSECTLCWWLELEIVQHWLRGDCCLWRLLLPYYLRVVSFSSSRIRVYAAWTFYVLGVQHGIGHCPLTLVLRRLGGRAWRARARPLCGVGARVCLLVRLCAGAGPPRQSQASPNGHLKKSASRVPLDAFRLRGVERNESSWPA